jgi:predicted nucleotide-binding protein
MHRLKVFTIHGTDAGNLRHIASQHYGDKGLQSLGFEKRSIGGAFVIEAVAKRIAGADLVVAIWTRDEQVIRLNGNVWRPRPNVIAETWYSMLALGLDRVIWICEEGVDIPTDFGGIGYDSTSGDGAAFAQLLGTRLEDVIREVWLPLIDHGGQRGG